MHLDISQNRQETKYTFKEKLLRVLWALVKVLFRLSPRPCFAFRRQLLRCFGAKVGEQVHVYPTANIYYPWNLKIDDYAAIGEWALIYNLGSLTVGRQATISQRAHICGGTHDYHQPSMPLIKTPIVIEANAWVCADAFVGPGVVVGTGAIVGARSVVMKDVPANAIMVGNPAKSFGKRS